MKLSLKIKGRLSSELERNSKFLPMYLFEMGFAERGWPQKMQRNIQKVKLESHYFRSKTFNRN